MSTPRRHSDVEIYRRLLRLARPYWWHMAWLFLISLLSSPLALLTPLPLKIAVDSVIGSHPLPGPLAAIVPAFMAGDPTLTLMLAVGLMVAITLTTHLTDLGTSLLRTYTEQKLVLGFRAQLFRHTQRLSLTYHDSKGTTDSVYRIQYDAPALQYIAMGTIPFITSGVTLVTMIYVTMRLDWQLALVALAVSPMFVVVSRLVRRRIRRQSREVKKLESAAQSVIQEVLASLRVVRAFGREPSEEERFVDRSRAGNRARLKMTVTEGVLSLVISLIMVTGTATVLYVGVTHVRSGTLTLGNLLLVMSYISQLYSPMRSLAKKAVSMQSYLTSAERAFEVLDEAPDVHDRPNARPLSRARGVISIRNVSFQYNEDRIALQDVSLDVPEGSRVGIAGRTGAGKSTLVSLLMRFYDPAGGTITLDGVDLRDYRLRDLRNQFGIVLQEPVLFSTTIGENIAYGRPGAADADVVRAAEAANIHHFIAGLPQGYDTQVGERGMQLSGGERQRISLARAFLKDAPILILDEPTSSVDVKTEADIVEAMERLMRGRTTFIIAHRLSTLEHCDVMLRLEMGRLVDVAPDQPSGDVSPSPLVLTAAAPRDMETHR